MKLIIISNRLPLKIVEKENGFNIISSQGGVATGLNSLEMKIDMHWVGWPGMYLEAGAVKQSIDEQLGEYHFHPVYLTPDQIANYYEGYSNSVFWPMCHYFMSYVHNSKEYWNAYQEVNALFCEAVLKIIEPEDIVWVQDYQLMLLPGMIRDKITDVAIGYFHHIPFPSYELFRSLPERAQLLKGLLGADLIGFHTHGYMRHFISAVYRVLKLDCALDEIQLDRRMVDVDAFPMGINYTKYYDAILDPEVKLHARELKAGFGKAKLILSVDRLDYSKGILIRLRSFEEFLHNHPEYIGKVSLTMVVSPSRDNVDMYAELKNEIDKMVGSINGTYSTADWNPIYYFYRSFSFEELTALYHIADIALVNPLRDGMNLVAKEYIAAKRDTPGVLILSEMAGASIELTDAIIINPSDVEEIGYAIAEALEMPEEEQLRRLKSMQEVLSTQTVKQWAKDFIEELRDVHDRNKALERKIVEKCNFKQIKDRYVASAKRLILLDYDGTLVGFKKNPLQACPTPELLDILGRLSSDPKNRVVISSGREKNILDKWLGHLPVGLAAEHGAFYKENGVWKENSAEKVWDEEILNIMKYIVNRTPNSAMEVKKTALVFHYRDVDVWLADLRVSQLLNALINPTSRNNLQIMKGNKIVEVKSANFNKGTEAVRLISQDNYDFVMAIGDDTTDEEMFMALPEEAITIKVGKNSSIAQYNLPTQQQTLIFLNNLMQ
jgi:trehalose 6-phosphate synthase/phosphatase